jgi:hypothetical protein
MSRQSIARWPAQRTLAGTKRSLASHVALTHSQSRAAKQAPKRKEPLNNTVQSAVATVCAVLAMFAG